MKPSFILLTLFLFLNPIHSSGQTDTSSESSKESSSDSVAEGEATTGEDSTVSNSQSASEAQRLGRSESEMPAAEDLVPLRFSPTAIGAQIGAPLLLFDRTDKAFSFGHRIFSFEKFLFSYSRNPAKKDQAQMSLSWDPGQMTPSRVVVLDDQGEVLVESEVALAGMNLKIGNEISLSSENQTGSGSGQLILALSGELVNLKKLQICLWDERAEKVSGSAPISDTQIFCGPADRSSDLKQGRFTIDGKVQAGKGEHQPQKGSFEMTFASVSGLSFRWSSVVPIAKIYEVFLRKDKKIEMVMYDGVAAGQADVLTEDRGAMFEATIGDLRKFSRVVMPSQIPFLSLKGPRNSVVHQKLNLKALPFEMDRIYLNEPAPKATYHSSIKLWGPHKKGQILDSKQNLVEFYDDEFKWEFASPKKYQQNRARIFLRNSNISGAKNKTTVFDYEVYRGFSTYLSGRIGLSLSSKLAASAALDLNFIHWFEDLGSSASWSRQRWGLSAGYMKTAVSSKPEEKYETGYLDLYYRFTPGVEGWTESVGLQTSFFQVKYRETEPTWMGGVGVFWNRSLPNWFNYLVGVLDFFKKPKWANFSAVYYAVPLRSGTKANGFQLKALARIDISQASYFEGGWALFATTYEYSKTRVTTGAGRAYLGYGYRW